MNYPGMSLRGEVRESISLDEDDLSDVEDEVFIRDGKTGYKLAEEITVKRPLMAPRRKNPKSDLGMRLKTRPPCGVLCRPCCYFFAALTALISLIVFVVLIVSFFPFTDKLNRFKNLFSTHEDPKPPCSSVRITEIWTLSFPKLTTESPVRLQDLNGDGFDDVIFGFGTGDNYEIVPEDTFCLVFMGVLAPCRGGVMALNGLSGQIIWKQFLRDSIFNLHCTQDVSGDQTNDCLAIGVSGTISMLNGKNGSLIWQQSAGQSNVFVGNFINDQNNDNISDVLTSHSTFGDNSEGHLILFCGKTGKELHRIAINGGAKTFYMPQVISQKMLLIGTGSPESPGNLTLVPLQGLWSQNKTFNETTLINDKSKGIMTQSVIIDLNLDGIPDFVTSLYNSTIMAFDGSNFSQIWNFSVEGGETNIVPTPGFFNYDQIPDFLVIFQMYNSTLSNFTLTYIIDGKTGKSIYKPIYGSINSQISALTIQSQDFGHDSFIFWVLEDNRENVTNLKLTLLNQFVQPPGQELYEITLSKEQNATISSMEILKEYLLKSKLPLEAQHVPEPILGKKQYSEAASSFRHKDQKSLIPQDYLDTMQEPQEQDYSWQNPIEVLPEDSEFLDETLNYNYLPRQHPPSNRDPRSKISSVSSIKKNLSDQKKGIYGYENIKQSKSQLLHDDSQLPTEILRENFFKNEEKRLRRTKFAQRDLQEHKDKAEVETKRILAEERLEAQNLSLNLWDLESEIELKDKASYRGKRDVVNLTEFPVKITSIGALSSSFNTSFNTSSLDLIFTYYSVKQPQNRDKFLQDSLQECLNKKKINSQEHDKVLQNQCLAEQETLRRDFKFFGRIHRLKFGFLKVVRIRLECRCDDVLDEGKCVKFLEADQQKWTQFLGRQGDGVF